MKWQREGTFTVSGETYWTDTETITLLRKTEKMYETHKDSVEAFAAVMFLGLRLGRIVKN